MTMQLRNNATNFRTKRISCSVCGIRSYSEMANSTTPPLQRACNAAQPAELKYTEESPPARLSEAVEYFGFCITKAFLVREGVYNFEGGEGLAKGE